jgi:hypothetical protein
VASTPPPVDKVDSQGVSVLPREASNPIAAPPVTQLAEQRQVIVERQGIVPVPSPSAPGRRAPVGTTEGVWRLTGIGGMSSGAVSALAYSAQLSVPLTRRFEVTVEAGQIPDVMPPSTRREIDLTADTLSQIGREPVAVDARVPALIGRSGLRFTMGARLFRPYVEGSAGLALLRPQVSFLRRGQNITGIAGASFQNQTSDLLVGVSSGVLVSLGRVMTVDLGYRFLRAYERGTPMFDLNQTVVGLGARF